MYCPKCGAELVDNANSCPNCDWKDETENTTEGNSDEIKVDDSNLENLDEIKVDLGDLENLGNPDDLEESEFSEDETDEPKPDDIVVDFDQIDNNVQPIAKKQNTWPVALVSFLAGVLATLVTIGCLNGAIMNTFDKMTQGVPDDVVQSYCESFFSTRDAKAYAKSLSPYFRAQILDELGNYSSYIDEDVDLDIDVSDDEKFEKVAEAYLGLVKEANGNSYAKIEKFEVSDVVYLKSGSEEFESYLNSYSQSASADNITLFADVTFTLGYTVVAEETTTVATQATTEAQTTTKAAKEDETTAKEGTKADETTVAETTTESTTVASTEPTTAEVYTQECTATCVKIGDTWYMYNLTVNS